MKLPNFKFLLVLCMTAPALAGAASGPQVDGKVTIDGKTFVLAHGRAWQHGFTSDVPDLEIYLAEKDVTDITGSSSPTDTAHGVGIEIDLSPDFGKPYQFCETTHHYGPKSVSVKIVRKNRMYPEYDSFSKFDAQDAIEVLEMSVTDWVATGKLHWKGKKVDSVDESATTDWSATFRVPIEGDHKTMLSGKDGAALCKK